MKDVVIVGGGAAGLMAASVLGEDSKYFHITVLEKNNRVGKRILASGAGKCNFTNLNLSPKYYSNQEFMTPFLAEYSPQRLIDYFSKIGVEAKTIGEERVYPITEQASSLLDCLRLDLARKGVKVFEEKEVIKLGKKRSKYLLECLDKSTYQADYVIFACGGISNPAISENTHGYQILNQFGVSSTKLYPGLVGLKSNEDYLPSLDGLRCKTKVSMTLKNKLVFEDTGEIQFKKDGFSGIVIMNCESFIKRHPANYDLYFDFVPDRSHKDCKKLLLERRKLFSKVELEYYFAGLLPKMVGNVIIKSMSIDLHLKAKDLSDKTIDDLVERIKHFKITYSGSYNYKNSQVTIGGIALDEVDDSFELKKLPHIFVCGEMLDLDGLCGGYNLHYAFCSGMKAATKIRNEK